MLWGNRRTASDVRATVQSFLAQVEYLGETICGVALGALAQGTTITVAFVSACGLVASAGVMVVRSAANDR